MPQTGDQFDDQVTQVWTALKTIIESVVAPSGGQHNATIVDQSPYDQGDYSGKVSSEADTDANGNAKIHAWIIVYAGPGGGWPTTVASAAPLLTFSVDFLYQQRLGSDTNNSMVEARRELNKVYWALATSPQLGLPGSMIERHLLLQTQGDFRVIQIGTRTAHAFFGRLQVQMGPQPIR